MQKRNIPNEQLSSRAKYRPEIDGLRALAVLAVILNHTQPNLLPSGYLGVDIFFVISGYVITSSLSNTHPESLTDLICDFYSRRIKRLFPALIACVLMTSVFISLLNPQPSESLNTGIAALFGGSNLYLLHKATDYFAASTKLNVFMHTWSLGVEEQFYLFYPILLWYALRPVTSQRLLKLSLALFVAAAGWLLTSKILTGSSLGLLPGGISSLMLLLPYLIIACGIPLAAYLKPNQSDQINALWLLSGLAGLSLGFFLFIYDRNFPVAYFLMPSRFWELASGCLLFLWFRGRPQAKALGRLAIWVLTLLVAALYLPLSLGKIATVMVVALTTALIGCLQPGTPAYQLLTHPWALRIGLMSYSLYLWHWSVLALSEWTVGISPQTIGWQVALMVVLGWASYRYIEQPFRRPSLLSSSRRVLGYGLAAMALAVVSVLGVKAKAASFSLDRRFPSDLSNQLAQGEFKTNRIENRVDPEQLIKSLTLDEEGRLLPHPRVYLMGDSHADHYKDALVELLPDQGVGSASIGWRCGYISPMDIEPLTRQWMSRCEDYKAFVDQFLEHQLHAGDTVIIAHRWKEKKIGVNLAATLAELATKLETKQATLILIDDTPELEVENPLFCEKRPWRPWPMAGCYQPLSKVNQAMKRMDEIGSTLAQRHANVHYLKLRDLYCDGPVCGPYVNKELIYRDNNHLNHAGSLLGAKKIAELIRQLSSLPPQRHG